MKTSLLPFATALILLLPCAAIAQGPPPQAGFSAEVALGVIVVGSADNLSPDGSKDTLTSLEQSAKTTTKVLAAVLPELRYNFGADHRSSWYFKMRPASEVAGFFAPTTGISIPVAGETTLDAGLFYLPLAEAYKNPYLVGERRSETDVLSWGGYLVADGIAGTPLRLQAALLTTDVDDDQLARLFPSLARDGEVYELAVGYGLWQGQPLSLKPQLIFSKGELDGEASSFTKIKAELAGMYIAGRLFVMPSLYYSQKQHDDQDPVFASTLKENGYGANLLLKYQGLMGSENLGLMAIAGYGIGDASEKFFDSESLVGGLGLTYTF